MTAEPVTIQVDEAQSVSGLWQAPADAAAALVLAHGAGASMAHRSMAAIADGLAARGVATLRYNFPYVERGSRRTDPPAICHDGARGGGAGGAAGASWRRRPIRRRFGPRSRRGSRACAGRWGR